MDFTGFALKIAEKTAAEIAVLKIEVFLGVFIGAVTFTGSVIAYGKLAGKVDGKAKKLPGGHVLNVVDWMYLMENGTIMNRSQFTKFGITVAELVATMRPNPARVPA